MFHSFDTATYDKIRQIARMKVDEYLIDSKTFIWDPEFSLFGIAKILHQQLSKQHNAKTKKGYQALVSICLTNLCTKPPNYTRFFV